MATIQMQQAACRAIALSGFGSPEDIARKPLGGLLAVHLTKPVDFRRLEDAMLQVTGSTPRESVASTNQK